MIRKLLSIVSPRLTIAGTAKMLDQVRPDWQWIIDEHTLDLGSPRKCVFGQIFGSFQRGCYRLGIQMSAGNQYGLNYHVGLIGRLWVGFRNAMNYNLEDSRHIYEGDIRREKLNRLRELWKQEIAARRRAR